MPHKEFLEDYSLFRKLNFNIPYTLDLIEKPAINMHCPNCKSIQTFNMTNEYYKPYGYSNVPSDDKKLHLKYLCQSCKNFEREFNIYVSPNLDYVYKYGQYPEWQIKMDKNFETILGKHSTTFRKGLVCESQGYGIAAFAYYRRITEEIIDELLESISDLVETENVEKYKIALEATKKTRVTQDKIELVKDLLPSILKPNGINPLGILHSELSEGLHAESDESCLENANHVKSILIFLVNQIIQSKQASKDFSIGMKSLLEKKASKL